MAVAETAAARKLLHGARGVAAFSFGLDGLWQLISGFFADIFAGLAHLLALPFEAIWHLLVAAANTVASGLGNLWHLVAGFFTNLFAGAAHLLVLPFEALWQWLVTVVAGAASAITSGLTDLWHLVAGFFPHLFAALAGAAHDLLVLPLAALWHWLAAAAGSIISGLGGLWHLVAGFFAHLFAALAGAAHQLLVLPAEALWHWLIGAAGAIASGLHGLWHFVVGFFPNLFAALAGAAHDLLVLPLEALWHWLQSVAAVALHCVLGALAVLLLVALACCFGPAICKAFVLSARFLAGGPGFVAARARAVSFRPLPRGQQQQQGDEEEESLLVGAVDATTAWGRGQEEEVHHAWHIRTEGLDERAVAAIGAVVYDAREHQLPPCAVCLAELRDGEALRLLPPCGHAFHRACIDPWLRDHVNCPNCRATVQVHTAGAKNDN